MGLLRHLAGDALEVVGERSEELFLDPLDVPRRQTQPLRRQDRLAHGTLLVALESVGLVEVLQFQRSGLLGLGVLAPQTGGAPGLLGGGLLGVEHVLKDRPEIAVLGHGRGPLPGGHPSLNDFEEVLCGLLAHQVGALVGPDADAGLREGKLDPQPYEVEELLLELGTH